MVIDVRGIRERFFQFCVAAVILLKVVGSWRLARPGIRVQADLATVAAFRVPYRSIEILQEYAQTHDIPFAKLFTVFNAENNFFPHQHAVYDLNSLEHLYVADFHRVARRYNSRNLAPYVSMFQTLFDEIEVFPIPTGWYEDDAAIMFGDSWGVEHNLQGNAKHMGTAIIDRMNVRGRVPVVSMTNGQIEQAGWDNNLGYFVSVITASGTYYLYAHLDSIAHGLTVGRYIEAGQFLGQMGNSGGGTGGATFPVHLHVAISPHVGFTQEQFWINPYPFLRHIEP